MEFDADDLASPMARSDETRLVQRAKRGSADAFRQLVEAYKDRLHAFIWRMIRNHHEAEDITQSAFVKAYEALGSYDAKYAFSTWLFTIGYRLCLNHLRKRKTVGTEVDFSRVDGHADDVAAAVANTEEARRLRNLIWSAVDELKPQQRAAVLLFYREGRSCEDIGQTLEIPAVTVKSHLHRARARLREVLSAELLGDRGDMRWLGDARHA